MSIIGVVGIKRSGKDTIADYMIKEYEYTRYSFADPIKRGAIEMFGFTEAQMWGSTEDKETVDPRWNVSPRKMLQLMGTELFQYDIHKYMDEGEFPVGRAVWVHKFKLWYQDQIQYNPDLKVVIADVRFLHEAKMITELGGKLVRVERPELTKNDTHASEVELEQIKADITIVNDKTLDDLYANVDKQVFNNEPKIRQKNVYQLLESFNFYDSEDETLYLGDIDIIAYDKKFDFDIDFENWSISFISDTHLVVSAGGDWEEGRTMILVPEGKMFKIISCCEGYCRGLDEDELIKSYLNGLK